MAEPFKHIYKVDLNQPLKRFDVGDILASGDEKANSFEVTVCRDGVNVDLAGCAVYGYFIRPNEETMKVNGTASGNKASVSLSKSCYVYDGAFSFAIKITGNGITQTVAVFDGRIVKTTTENIVDGDRVIYGLEDLLAQIAATEAAAKSANTAASSANTATSNANTATTNANNATTRANTAAATIENMTVSSEDVGPDVSADAEVTTANSAKNIHFKLRQGKTGATPNITFNVATGEPGTQVEIRQSGTPENPVVNLTIPRGDTGAVDGIDYYEGNPSALGTSSPGTANGLARGDHVHPMPTAADVGALPVTGGTVTGELRVGESGLRIWEDNEGGNMRVYPPAGKGVDFWEMDAFNGKLRVYAQRNADNTYGDGLIFPLTLNNDGSITVGNNAQTRINLGLSDAAVGLMAYPVGSIYLSVNSTSPASLFGGTWTQLKDRFLLGAGASYSNGATGGAATVTLTTDQMPSHAHGFLDYWNTASDAIGHYAVALNGDGTGSSGATNSRSQTANTGGGAAHNNMPPYLVVYMWKRVS